MIHLLPNILLYNDESVEIYGKKQYSNDFINRLANIFNKKKILILNCFHVNSIAKVKVNLFANRQALLTYLKSFLDVSNYCVGAVCNGEICYYINEENITDFAKARLYDCINYS